MSSNNIRSCGIRREIMKVIKVNEDMNLRIN